MQGPGTKRHDRVGTRMHWELCRKYVMECSAGWYEHKPQVVSQNASGDVNNFWAHRWTTTVPAAHNTPDVVVKDSKAKLWSHTPPSPGYKQLKKARLGRVKSHGNIVENAFITQYLIYKFKQLLSNF